MTPLNFFIAQELGRTHRIESPRQSLTLVPPRSAHEPAECQLLDRQLFCAFARRLMAVVLRALADRVSSQARPVGLFLLPSRPFCPKK